jgi:formamidopyrimidine-DNA glycosylase
VPELPDITIYLEALERRLVGQPLKQVRITSPFLLRTAVPPIHRVQGRKVTSLRRLGNASSLASKTIFGLCCI